MQCLRGVRKGISAGVRVGPEPVPPPRWTAARSRSRSGSQGGFQGRPQAGVRAGHRPVSGGFQSGSNGVPGAGLRAGGPWRSQGGVRGGLRAWRICGGARRRCTLGRCPGAAWERTHRERSSARRSTQGPPSRRDGWAVGSRGPPPSHPAPRPERTDLRVFPRFRQVPSYSDGTTAGCRQYTEARLPSKHVESPMPTPTASVRGPGRGRRQSAAWPR